MHRILRTLALAGTTLAALLLPPARAVADDRPFVFGFDADGPKGFEVQAFYHLNAGSAGSGAVRFADPSFGRVGIVHQLGAQVGITRWLAASAYGMVSMGNPTDDPVGAAGGGNLQLTFLRPKPGRNGASIGLKVDAHREFAGVASLSGTLLVGGSIGPVRLGGDVAFEKRFAEEADGVDVMVTVSANAALSRSVRLGVEYVGQDLEDLWEEEEAEGGAAHIIAPSLTASLVHDRLWIGAAPGIVVSAQGAGFGGRAGIGWRF